MIWLAEEQIPRKWGAAASSKIHCHITELRPSRCLLPSEKKLLFYFSQEKEGCLPCSSLCVPLQQIIVS